MFVQCESKVMRCDAGECLAVREQGTEPVTSFLEKINYLNCVTQAVYKLHRFGRFGVAVIILSSPRCFLSICHVRPGFLLIGRNK